jgi:(p)ppGpp synthase/HD superfamily hydrolase
LPNDTVEDTLATIEDIEENYPEVARLVTALPS